MGNYGVTSKLVWDGSDRILIPSEMGEPRSDQLQGSVFEQLSELGGRVCYDSVGSGRTSSEYHKHIQEVGHLSVYEHAHMTVEIFLELGMQSYIFVNRPGLWIVAKPGSFRVTFNPRTIRDWDMWSASIGVDDFIDKTSDFKIGHILAYHAEKAYPMMVQPRKRESEHEEWIKRTSCIATPVHDEEKWISMFMAGSRGFSHELVRHGDRTAISQRSTRFVNEAESEWIDHPLVQEYDKHLAKTQSVGDAAKWIDRIWSVKSLAQKIYSEVVETLQPWLVSKGVDKTTARKQARGAARGYLGNALLTELIFSASVGQWKRMLRMRACAPADAEIRAVFVQALASLKESRYADDFKAFQIEPSPDGLGQIAVEKIT
jgi:thymidylate synthase ThyX